MTNFNSNLKKKCLQKNNRLCFGLDIDNLKLKNTSLMYMQDYIIDIINATIDLCPVYKVNFSFYERYGSKGIKILEKINKTINGRAISIADAKRGDIGNSSKYYAESIFKHFNFDSITVSPYMGEDSLKPFIDYHNKGIFILCLTSNVGSKDLQTRKCIEGIPIYQHVIKMALKMNVNNNVGLVVGATNDKYLKKIKGLSNDMPLLMPGVGFQRGNLYESINVGDNNGLAIINVSRGILNSGDRSVGDIVKATERYTNKIREIL